MRTRLEIYKKQISELLDKIERDVANTKSEWEQRKGVFKDGGYVYKENLNVFEAEIHSIQRVKELVRSIDVAGYDTIYDFKAHIISELEDLYDRAVLMRSGISIVIDTIKKFDVNIQT